MCHKVGSAKWCLICKHLVRIRKVIPLLLLGRHNHMSSQLIWTNQLFIWHWGGFITSPRNICIEIS